MKKVLLATTALVLSAGVAAADVTLSGSANVGLKYDEGNTSDELRLHYELDFGVSGATMTDAGLSVGASIDLDAEIDSASGDANTNDVKDPEVFISGSFGTLTVGDLDPATDPLGAPDAGFDGIGLDDDADALRTALSSANLNYEYVAGDISFLFSYHTIDGDFGLNVTYGGPMFTVALGYADAGDTNGGAFGLTDITESSAITLDGSVDLGDFSVGGHYTTWDATSTGSGDVNGDAYSIDVGYSVGATTVTAVYGVLDVDGVTNDDDFGIGVEYDLGGGVTLGGGIGSVNDDLVADFGLNMSF